MRLAAENLTVVFGHGSRAHVALDDVSVGVAEGTTLGLVGESGSGKSTLAKALVGLVRPRTGRILLDGADVSALRGARLAAVRRRVQMISQDPYSSLNPRMTVGQAIAEAIDPRRADHRRHADAVTGWLETVALDGDAAARYPHEFSGGQRQRIAIARALAAEPEVVVADEITSALDCSVQAEVLNLLAGLRERLRLTMVFISHDLAVVRHVSDEVAVMNRGRIVEYGPCRRVYRSPPTPTPAGCSAAFRRSPPGVTLTSPTSSASAVPAVPAVPPGEPLSNDPPVPPAPAGSPSAATTRDLLSGLPVAALTDFYRDLHAHPELSMREHRTAARLAGRLRDAGLETVEGIGGTGVAAVLRNGDGPTVMIRGDMDALPVTEETGLPYASTVPGIMHACGHDLHVTCLAGAAESLARGRDAWSGTLLVVGQPGEETAEGALAMLDDGLFSRLPARTSSSASTSAPARWG
nr:hypothetical protein GCM10020093_011930 [Planobispora longispora]